MNLTQHIEGGYQEGNITDTAFVDLSAAYDTVKHILLIQKLYNTTQDRNLCRVIQNLLSNRNKQVEEITEEALDNLAIYYKINSLRANPEKTWVAAFHLRNKEANR